MNNLEEKNLEKDSKKVKNGIIIEFAVLGICIILLITYMEIRVANQYNIDRAEVVEKYKVLDANVIYREKDMKEFKLNTSFEVIGSNYKDWLISSNKDIKVTVSVEDIVPYTDIIIESMKFDVMLLSKTPLKNNNQYTENFSYKESRIRINNSSNSHSETINVIGLNNQFIKSLDRNWRFKPGTPAEEEFVDLMVYGNKLMITYVLLIKDSDSEEYKKEIVIEEIEVPSKHAMEYKDNE